jgi:hypothetical protein
MDVAVLKLDNLSFHEIKSSKMQYLFNVVFFNCRLLHILHFGISYFAKTFCNSVVSPIFEIL